MQDKQTPPLDLTPAAEVRESELPLDLMPAAEMRESDPLREINWGRLIWFLVIVATASYLVGNTQPPLLIISLVMAVAGWGYAIYWLSKRAWRLVTAKPKSLAVLAVVIVLISFASLHIYYPRFGIISNLMIGEIWIQDVFCGTQDDEGCAIVIPFKWIFVLAALMGGAGFIIPPKTGSGRKRE